MKPIYCLLCVNLSRVVHSPRICTGNTSAISTSRPFSSHSMHRGIGCDNVATSSQHSNAAIAARSESCENDGIVLEKAYYSDCGHTFELNLASYICKKPGPAINELNCRNAVAPPHHVPNELNCRNAALLRRLALTRVRLAFRSKMHL